MKLPDFFNSRFNHLHRSKERKYEAEKVSEKIGKVMTDLHHTMLELLNVQQIFKEEQKKRFIQALEEKFLMRSNDSKSWIRIFMKHLPNLDC